MRIVLTKVYVHFVVEGNLVIPYALKGGKLTNYKLFCRVDPRHGAVKLLQKLRFQLIYFSIEKVHGVIFFIACWPFGSWSIDNLGINVIGLIVGIY